MAQERSLICFAVRNFAEVEIFELQVRAKRRIFFLPFLFISPLCACPKDLLRMFEYMLQSRESSWGLPIYFIDHSEFITVQCEKILGRANNDEITCFEFDSIYKESIKTSLENNYSWINFNISICFPLWENMTILSK